VCVCVCYQILRLTHPLQKLETKKFGVKKYFSCTTITKKPTKWAFSSVNVEICSVKINAHFTVLKINFTWPFGILTKYPGGYLCDTLAQNVILDHFEKSKFFRFYPFLTHLGAILGLLLTLLGPQITPK